MQFLRDGIGQKVPLSWWVRTEFAFWCLRQWLMYEKMLKSVKTDNTDEILKWNRKIVKYVQK